MIFYGSNIGVFSQEQMTACAGFEIKANSDDVSLQSLYGPERLYYLLKYKYMIKAAAAYAITLHLPGEKRQR